MKHLEKLLVESLTEYVRENDVKISEEPHYNKGFLAGFCKARELAAEMSIKLEDPQMQNLWHWQKSEYFKNLGEAEVQDDPKSQEP